MNDTEWRMHSMIVLYLSMYGILWIYIVYIIVGSLASDYQLTDNKFRWRTLSSKERINETNVKSWNYLHLQLQTQK